MRTELTNSSSRHTLFQPAPLDFFGFICHERFLLLSGPDRGRALVPLRSPAPLAIFTSLQGPQVNKCCPTSLDIDDLQRINHWKAEKQFECEFLAQTWATYSNRLWTSLKTVTGPASVDEFSPKAPLYSLPLCDCQKRTSLLVSCRLPAILSLKQTTTIVA